MLHVVDSCCSMYIGRALLLQSMYVCMWVCSLCMHVSRVDCVHTVCRWTMKFYTKVGVHTRKPKIFPEIQRVGGIKEYRGLSARKRSKAWKSAKTDAKWYISVELSPLLRKSRSEFTGDVERSTGSRITADFTCAPWKIAENAAKRCISRQILHLLGNWGRWIHCWHQKWNWK
jgi:hypothetical protein